MENVAGGSAKCRVSGCLEHIRGRELTTKQAAGEISLLVLVVVLLEANGSVVISPSPCLLRRVHDRLYNDIS